MPISEAVLAEFTRSAGDPYCRQRPVQSGRGVFWGRKLPSIRTHVSRQPLGTSVVRKKRTADRVCQALAQFRLNAKHLQLFFNDGTDADFPMTERGPETYGTTVG